jgi:two-component system sensor histidine kinase BaeS
LEAVQDGLAPDPTAAVSGLHEQVLHLTQLVDDLQELALAESRELRLQIADVDLDQLVSSAIRAAGMEQDARVSREIAPGLAIHADAVRTRQVLTNLLTNAARHTPDGGAIAIRGRLDGTRAAVEVQNTGSALDPDQLARIFERFYRTDPSRQRDTGGTGLGLAIVKHLVEAQGGTVFAASDATGVTVGFLAPTPSPARPPSAPSAPASVA